MVVSLAGLGAIVGDPDADEEQSDAPVTTEAVTTEPSTSTATSTRIHIEQSERPAPGGGVDATSESELSDDEILKQAVEEYVMAFGDGDPDAAVALLSERCADTEPLAQYRAAVASAGELYPGLVVDEFLDIILDDDRAVVFYSTDPVLEAGDGERWIIESDAWAWDDC